MKSDRYDHDLMIEKKNYLYKKAISQSYLFDYSKYCEFIIFNKFVISKSKKINDKKTYNLIKYHEFHKLFLIWCIDKDFYEKYMKIFFI